MKWILGSTSPRRRDLLGMLGIAFEVASPATEELRRPGESPEAYVERNAREKAADVLSRQSDPEAVVIAGDTIVVLGSDILEKPQDPAHAREMLGRLQGQTHFVLSGVAVQNRLQSHSFVVRTDVTLKSLTAEEISGYVASGEPLDKAGAYAAQGLGSFMVKRIDGSYTNVVGLPTAELVDLLTREFGLILWQ